MLFQTFSFLDNLTMF